MDMKAMDVVRAVWRMKAADQAMKHRGDAESIREFHKARRAWQKVESEAMKPDKCARAQ